MIVCGDELIPLNTILTVLLIEASFSQWGTRNALITILPFVSFKSATVTAARRTIPGLLRLVVSHPAFTF